MRRFFRYEKSSELVHRCQERKTTIQRLRLDSVFVSDPKIGIQVYAQGSVHATVGKNDIVVSTQLRFQS